MKNNILLFLFLFVSINFSQSVSTLVTGPSTFDDGLALDKEGNIYAAHYFGTTVTKINPDGSSSIFASGFTNPNGIAFDNDGNLLVPNATAGRIDKVSPGGEKSLFINIENPSSIHVNRDNSIYVAHYALNKISFIDSIGNVSIFWIGDGLDGPVGIDLDNEGNLYVGNFNNGKVLKRNAAGIITEIGDIDGSLGFITFARDAIYATALDEHKIYKVPTNGSGQTLFAGSRNKGQLDGSPLNSSFNGPNGIISTSTGDTLYITDLFAQSLRMITGVNPVTSVTKNNFVPEMYLLEQNYPNPFNPSTTIEFSVPKSGNYSIRIYNSLSQLIKTLTNDFFEQGTHSLKFDSDSLPSGIYMYQLIGTNVNQTKKMLLLK